MNPALLSPESTAVPSARISTPGILNLGLLSVLGLGFSVLMWPQWLHNPDLSHALFMPIVCLILLHEARGCQCRHYLTGGWATKIAFVTAIGVGLAALILGGLYAAASEWAHPVVSLMLAIALTSFMGAALLSFSLDSVRLLPFNWSAILAASLWVLSAPIPPGTYSRLTLGLQLWVSENVLRALHWLGIAASRHGNIIELANTSVGVEEACSGVRSLVSCVFAGLFFSGCLVRRPSSRSLIIALSAPLALGMNFIRSLTLTLLANSGTDIGGLWHDLTGFAVLAVTAAILALLALSLERGEKVLPSARLITPAPTAVSSRSTLQNPLIASLVLATVIALFFGVSTSSQSQKSTIAVPNLEALLPLSPAGWDVTTTTDLNRFKDTLRTDHFVQRTYLKNSSSGLLQITVYIAYWSPGQASVSQVATHTPDACWPGAGWAPVTTTTSREVAVVVGHPLAPAEHRLFVSNNYPQHVWFWHLYDHRPVEYLDPLSPRNVIKIALRHGFHREGDQLFVRLSSNRPWTDLAAEPLISEIFAGLQPFGL
jgi:exosortase